MSENMEFDYLMEPPSDITIKVQENGLITFKIEFDDDKMEPLELGFEGYEALAIAEQFVKAARELDIRRMLENKDA